VIVDFDLATMASSFQVAPHATVTTKFAGKKSFRGEAEMAEFLAFAGNHSDRPTEEASRHGRIRKTAARPPRRSVEIDSLNYLLDLHSCVTARVHEWRILMPHPAPLNFAQRRPHTSFAELTLLMSKPGRPRDFRIPDTRS
jgi:hypothetical protein